MHFYFPLRAAPRRPLTRALAYLSNVRQHKEIVPVRRYTRGVGRKAQATVWGVSQGRWPLSCVNALIDLLKNAQSNATSGLPAHRPSNAQWNDDQTIDGRTEPHDECRLAR